MSIWTVIVTVPGWVWSPTAHRRAESRWAA